MTPDRTVIRYEQGPRGLEEHRSPEWCWQTVDYVRSQLQHVSRDWRAVGDVISELVEARAWEVVPPGRPYGSLDELLRAEFGLDGQTMEEAARQVDQAIAWAEEAPPS